MTDAQARRIEKLLRLHALQLHNLIVQTIGVSMMVAKDDDHTKKMGKLIMDSKKLVLDTIVALNEEIRKEGQPELDDLATKLKN